MHYFKTILFLIAAFSISNCSHLPNQTAYKKTVIAHRGASGYLPEHTLPAAAMAHAWGVDFIEPDVVVTRDRIPVVLHDIHLETSTNVEKVFPHRKRKDGHYYVVDFTLAEIRKLRVHERSKEEELSTPAFEKRFPIQNNSESFQLPTFEEFIQIVQGLNHSTQRSIGIYPEIKNPAFHRREGKDITKIILAMLKKYGFEDHPENIFIQCFDPIELKRLKNEFKSKIPRIQLIGKNEWEESSADYNQMLTQKGLKEVASYALGIGPSIDQLYSLNKGNRIQINSVSDWAKQSGLKIHPYTLRLDALPPGFKSAEDVLDFLFDEAKVDGVFSDFADQVLLYLKKKHH